MNVKIGTYNIQHGVDRLHFLKTKESKVDLTAVVDAIRTMELDICGLQEVYDHFNYDWGKEQAKAIAEQLGYHFVFAEGSLFRWGKCGNALISKYPILSTRLIPLHILAEQRVEGRLYEDRVILIAKLDVEGTVITVMCTHYGLNGDELNLAIEATHEAVKNCKTPLLFMGDLNFGPTTGYYAKLCDFLTDSAVLMNKTENTFPSEAPNNRIDYIFTNGQIKIVDVCVPELVVTDHRPYTIIAEI